jgi:hypothetical protein
LTEKEIDGKSDKIFSIYASQLSVIVAKYPRKYIINIKRGQLYSGYSLEVLVHDRLPHCFRPVMAQHITEGVCGG